MNISLIFFLLLAAVFVFVLTTFIRIPASTTVRNENIWVRMIKVTGSENYRVRSSLEEVEILKVKKLILLNNVLIVLPVQEKDYLYIYSSLIKFNK